jgi:hypothetical protein
MKNFELNSPVNKEDCIFGKLILQKTGRFFLILHILSKGINLNILQK